MIEIPGKAEVNAKDLETEIILLKRRIKALEERVNDLEGS